VPNIQEYNANAQLRPDNMGAEAYAMEGRRVGAFFHQEGADIANGVDQLAKVAGQHQEFQEISRGTAAGATLMNGLSQGLNDTLKNADPNDPTVVQKWKDETMEPALAEFQKNFTTPQGKMWAMEHAAQLRQHFTEIGTADMSTMAGNAAVLNLETTKNQAGAMTYQDPTSADLSRGMYQNSVEALIKASPNMTADTASSLRLHAQQGLAEITVAQYRGMIDKNPQAGLDAVNKGGGPLDQYLDQAQREALQRYGESSIRLQTESAKAAAAAAKAEGEAQGKSAVADLRSRMVGPNGELLVTPQIVAEYKQLATGKYAQYIPGELSGLGSVISEASRAKLDNTYQTTNPRVYSVLAGGIGHPAGTPGALTADMVDTAYAHHQLSDHDYHFFHDAIERTGKDPNVAETQRRMNEAFTAMKPAVGKTDAFGSLFEPQAAQNFYRFQSDVQNTIDNERAAGKTEDQIRKDLLDPTGAHYIGNPNTLSHYVITTKASAMEQAMRLKMTAAPGPAPAGQQAPAGGTSQGGGLTPDQQAWLKSYRGH